MNYRLHFTLSVPENGVIALWSRFTSIVFLDTMHFKVRVDGKVTSKAFYTVLAVTPEGTKDILGLYLSENEGARFWVGVLNDLKTRGVEDILNTQRN